MGSDTKIPGDAQGNDLFNLDDNEKILWQGRPVQGVSYRWEDMLGTPVGIVFCVMSSFWIRNVINGKSAVEILVLAILLFCGGLYIIFGTPIADAIIRRKIFYFVTNMRIVIVNASFLPGLYCAELQDLPPIRMIGDDERATLYFGSPDTSLMRSPLRRPSSLSSTPKFIQIENPKKVLEIIMRAIADLPE